MDTADFSASVNILGTASLNKSNFTLVVDEDVTIKPVSE